MTDPVPHLVLPSTYDSLAEAREWVAGHARAAGFDGRDVLDLELVVTEAVSNVVRHAYGGEPGRDVELDAQTEPGSIVLRITDHGEPFTGTRAVAPDGSRGYGLGLIEQLVDSMTRSAVEGSNTLELVKHRPGGSS